MNWVQSWCIIAEVFTGLAKGEPNCFLNIDPGWTPSQAGASGEQIIQFDGDLELKDLVDFALGIT